MAQTEDDKKFFSKYFKVEFKGLKPIEGVVEVDCGRVTVSVEECTQGDKPEYRTYTYGSHKYEPMTIVVQQGPGFVELQNWHESVGKTGGKSPKPGGDALRRDISVYMLARDKSTVVRTVNCFQCFPINFNAGDHSTGSDVKTATLTCKVDRIEVA